MATGQLPYSCSCHGSAVMQEPAVGFGILSLASICPIAAAINGLLIQIMNRRSVNEQSSKEK